MTGNDSWVGSWRPHIPRGPIAALYSSPGPKYALPGLTGDNRHDPTKWKAPMYSFGIRHEHSGSKVSPGPQYVIPSNVSRVGRDASPAFSISGRPRSPKVARPPGPGQYSPERSGKSVFCSAPAYSLCGRTKDIAGDRTPVPAAFTTLYRNEQSPGSYTLPAVLGRTTVATVSAPGYSLYGRNKTGSFHEDLRKTPSPAAYKVVDPCVYSQKAPQYSMSGRNYVPSQGTKTPGPGSHYPEFVTVTKYKAPSFSFGLRHSQYISPAPREAE